MTAFKPGDRVHVEYDGEVADVYDDPQHVWVNPEPTVRLYVPIKFCTLVRPPLAVGDVLTADDPEPPVGTVLRNDFGTFWVRKSSGWYAPGDTGCYTWATIPVSLATVLYVPEDTP